MNKKHLLAVVAFVFQIVTGCASTGGIVKEAPDAAIRERALASETAALNFFKMGGFKKSAEFFEEATTLYGQIGDKAAQQRALIASTKTYLWCNDRQKFLGQVKLLRESIGRNAIPARDVRFILNLADRIEGRELSYPLESGQEEIFD